MILTTEGLPFNSIALKGRMTSNGSQLVYKVFSKAPMEEVGFFFDMELTTRSKALLSSIFANHTVAASFPWAAYPVLTPLSASAPSTSFVLHPNLYYLNAFETAISCMETSVLAAKNVINALAKATQLE
jgi:hypothetical protein